MFKFCGHGGGGSVWLWKLVSIDEDETFYEEFSHVIVVRGSFTVFDWLHKNVTLLYGALGLENTYDDIV